MIYTEIKVAKGVSVTIKYNDLDISKYELKQLTDNITIAMSKVCYFKDGVAYGKSKLNLKETK